MGDNGRFYLKLVKATLITIVMLGAPWTEYNGHVLGHHGRVHGAPLLALMSMVPRLQKKYVFF